MLTQDWRWNNEELHLRRDPFDLYILLPARSLFLSFPLFKKEEKRRFFIFYACRHQVLSLRGTIWRRAHLMNCGRLLMAVGLLELGYVWLLGVDQVGIEGGWWRKYIEVDGIGREFVRFKLGPHARGSAYKEDQSSKVNQTCVREPLNGGISRSYIHVNWIETLLWSKRSKPGHIF